MYRLIERMLQRCQQQINNNYNNNNYNNNIANNYNYHKGLCSSTTKQHIKTINFSNRHSHQMAIIITNPPPVPDYIPCLSTISQPYCLSHTTLSNNNTPAGGHAGGGNGCSIGDSCCCGDFSCSSFSAVADLRLLLAKSYSLHLNIPSSSSCCCSSGLSFSNYKQTYSPLRSLSSKKCCLLSSNNNKTNRSNVYYPTSAALSPSHQKPLSLCGTSKTKQTVTKIAPPTPPVLCRRVAQTVLAFGTAMSKLRRQTQVLGALYKQLEPRDPAGTTTTNDNKSDYAVISIPLQLTVHRSAYDIISNLPMFILRLERLMFRSLAVVAASLSLAIALPRLLHITGGRLSFDLIPQVLILMVPFIVAMIIL
eukprot:GHVS01075325.1.p1 GENE.GHVS01075325.1~~GHVS01075325.1.p1  ORF type:complete len:365 (+),score=67.84 GHVS01075325.1:412-1506(+)